MESFLAILEGISVTIHLAGVCYKTVKKLREYLRNNVVVQDKFWDTNVKEKDFKTVKLSGWTEDEHVRSERAYIKAAFECYDALYNFLKLGKSREYAYFTCCLQILNDHGQVVTTRKGTTLCIDSEDSEECAFDKVSDFIYDVLDIGRKNKKTILRRRNIIMLDANVFDDLRHMRTPEDNEEIISMAIVILEVLKEVADVPSDGNFIKVSPKLRNISNTNMPSMAYITARWPNEDLVAAKAIAKMKDALEDVKDDFNELIEKVHQCYIDDGVRNILLLGRTGSGKSHTGNWILQTLGLDASNGFLESSSGSMTSFVQYLPVAESEYRIWDTPGLNDMYGRDALHIDSIERCVLEMGSVSAVILCLANMERIDSEIQKIIRRLYSIIGTPFATRIIVLVNLQSTPIDEDQIKSLQDTLDDEIRVQLPTENIHDLGRHSSDLSMSRFNAIRQIVKMCSEPSIRAGYMEKLLSGLMQLQKLIDKEERADIQDKLVWMSSRILRRRLQRKDGEPQLLCDLSLGKTFVISNQGIQRRDESGKRVTEEHIFALPEVVTKKFSGRLRTFLFGMTNRYNPVYKVINRIREDRLVFLHDPKTNQYEDRNGRLIKKIHYELFSVDEALNEHTRDLIQRSINEKHNSPLLIDPNSHGNETENTRPLRRSPNR